MVIVVAMSFLNIKTFFNIKNGFHAIFNVKVAVFAEFFHFNILFRYILDKYDVAVRCHDVTNGMAASEVTEGKTSRMRWGR